MSLTLYAHPFAAYCWKPLIALYENATPFTYRLVEDAAGWAELESLWPIKKFPLLRDGDATIVESSIIVEYLMCRYPGTTRMIPVNDDAALTVRFMDRFFDNYVMGPTQTLVSDRMRTETERDAKASPTPGRCWTLRMDGLKNSSRLKRGRPVAPSAWRIVPPLQRFSTRIGCIQSAIDFREFSPTAAGFLLGPLSPASLMRRVHSASSSLRERRIGTDERPAVSSACRNVEWLLSDEHSSVVTGAIWPRLCDKSPVLSGAKRH
jgi:glutathione S-transferase